MVIRRRPQDKEICFIDDLMDDLIIIQRVVSVRIFQIFNNDLGIKGNDSTLCTEHMTDTKHITYFMY